MSIIQSIRDKASWLIITLVVLGLVGFILMDSSISRGTFFSGNANVVGEVDGKEITYQEYQAALDKAEKQYSRNGTLSDADKLMLSDQVFQSLKEQKAMSAVYERIGLRFTESELQTILSGQVELGIFRGIPAFVDAQTGRTNVNMIRSYISSLQQQSAQNPEAKQNLADFIEEIEKSAIREKYINLLKGVQHEPKWLVQYEIASAEKQKTAAVLSVPYYQVGIDKMKIEDADVDVFVKKYTPFIPAKENRKALYLLVNGDPTSVDTANILSAVAVVKSGLEQGKNPNELASLTTATINYKPHYYVLEDDIKQLFPTKASTIIGANLGSVIGPFIDGMSQQQPLAKMNYNLVKLISKRKIPQSVSVRHILVAVMETRSEQQAKQTADSISSSITKGGNFEQFVSLSDDGGSKQKGGRYDFNYSRDFLSLDSAFGATSFYSPVGTKKVIKTQFGYHYLEILNQSEVKDGYEMVYVHQPIEPSVATETAAFSEANQFSIVAQSKGFEATAKEMKRQVVPELPTYSRDLHTWLYKAEEGNVSSPIKVGNQYVVATLTSIVDPQKNLHDELKEKLTQVIQKQKAVKALAENNKASLSSLASTYKATIATMNANGKDVLVRDSSNALYEPELAGVILGATQQKEAKVLGPIMGKSSVFFVSDVQSSSFSGDASQIRQQTLFIDMRNANYVERSAVSAYVGTLKQEDNRDKF